MIATAKALTGWAHGAGADLGPAVGPAVAVAIATLLAVAVLVHLIERRWARLAA